MSSTRARSNSFASAVTEESEVTSETSACEGACEGAITVSYLGARWPRIFVLRRILFSGIAGAGGAAATQERDSRLKGSGVQGFRGSGFRFHAAGRCGSCQTLPLTGTHSLRVCVLGSAGSPSDCYVQGSGFRFRV